MNQYIITEDMLQAWRRGCPPSTEDCKTCEYRGKGKREGCCDFDDNLIEKIFRSHPYQSEIDTQCKRVSEKLIFDRCDNCCDKCIFCDNAGGCLVESYRSRFHSYQSERDTISKELALELCMDARKDAREKVLDEFAKWVREYDTMYYGDDMPVDIIRDKLEELRQAGESG
jgi:hypothetical protein